jgi:hypothetical protein
MIDAVRNSTLPSNMMQFAAKGALLVPSQEMIEILVHLAKHNKVFGQQARLTLAGWDEASSRQAAANPETPKEVLDYFIDPENLRPALLPALLENVSVNENFLVHLAASGSREQVELLLNSPRASCSRAVLEVLAASPTLTAAATARVREKLSALADAKVSAGAVAEVGQVTATNLSGAPAAHAGIQEHSSDVPDEAVHAFMSQHAAEIAAEGDKPFQPVSALHEDLPAEAAEIPADAKSMAAAAAAGNSEATPAVHKTVEKKWVLSAEEQRGSALQKIAKLDIKGRVLLAMKGTKEERSLLIRDGTKIVAFAVLESPKLTDGEVEKFASQKNVLESVLREISIKRRFIKQYPVVRSLTFNPRTPIDVSLGLLKHLLIQDLRSLAGNKEVSDTVRKLASKMFRQKLEVKKS